MLDQGALDQGRGQVFTAADDHVLDAPGNRQIALRIEAPEIAGPQPSAVEGLFHAIADIAAHQGRPADADLALVSFLGRAGVNSLTICPASTCPTVPIRRLPGGFMVEVQVASDKP